MGGWVKVWRGKGTVALQGLESLLLVAMAYAVVGRAGPYRAEETIPLAVD